MRFAFATFFALFTFLPSVLAQGDSPTFFRIEAIEYNDTEVPNEVKMNIPITLVRTLQPQLDEALADADFGHYHEQFRQAWQEIKDAGPFNVVEIFHEGESIRVSTTETHVIIKAKSKEIGNAIARIPLALGDAFFNMSGKIDFNQILSQVSLLSGQDLVTVESDKFDLRIWVD